MYSDKKVTCFTLERDIYHKLNIIATVKRFYFDKDASMAKIANEALREYFENHSDEINDMMDKYHEKGGLFYL